MKTDEFKVIYTGKIKDGFEINHVAEEFALRFKVTSDKALSILNAEREITLNKKADHIKAYKLKLAFEEIGLKVRLERLLFLVSHEELEDQKPEPAPKSEPEQEIKTPIDDHSETNDKITRASDSWELDPMHTNEEIESEENSSQLETTDKDTVDQPKKVVKSDFNYTGLSNSPVINTNKSQKNKKASSKKMKKTDENEEVKEKVGFGKSLKNFVKGFVSGPE